MKLKNKIFIFAGVAIFAFAFYFFSSHIANASGCPALSAGDMIKVSGRPAIYVLNKNKEVLYFPNGDVFKSWRPNYGGYISISQECYDSLPIPKSLPGGVNFMPGSYILKRPSSSQFYIIEPNNTVAKITLFAAEFLYGSNFKPMIVSDLHWLNYINKGDDITLLKPHAGMVVSANNKNYYVEDENVLREISSIGLSANGLQSKFIRSVASSVLAGFVYGGVINGKLPFISEKTQSFEDKQNQESNNEDSASAQQTESISEDADGIASENIFFVSPNGDNSNSGTRQKPWATPGFASRQLKAGDTLIILSGRYELSAYDDDIIIPPSGASGAWITIKGEDLNNMPVLAGKNNLLTAIDLSNKNYIDIENLEITSDNGALFRDGVEAVNGPANHIVLKNLYIHHLDEFGVNIGDVNDLKITDSKFFYCGFGGVGGPAGQSGGWRNVTIKNTQFSYSGHYYQGGNGLNRPYDRPDGFGIEISDGPITLENVKSEHNYGDGLDSKAAHTTISKAIVANNSCDGVKLWGHDSKVENTLIYGTGDGVGGDSPWAGIVIDQIEYPNANFEITNVTLHDNPSRVGYSIYAQYPPSNAKINLKIKNSIFANSQGVAYFGDTVNLTAENNIFYRPGEDAQVYSNGRDYTSGDLNELGEGNFFQDPKFIRSAWGSLGDYNLKSDSPAIDKGESVGSPSVDLDGKARPRGAGTDIGAYEY
ncbi:MAG: choice-of-anchor Q domain-containing protein [Patescibacteria group bacterium]